MLIPEATIEQIRNANDIVEVISGYVPLKKKGREFAACCPFHSEKTPSFTVIPQKQIFYCFGCHKGGDVFKFLCEYENLSYPEAIRRLAERAGIEIQLEQGGSGISRSVKDALLHTQEVFTEYWHQQLLNSPEGQIARDYLAQRGVSSESIHEFRLGYSPMAWEDTPREAQRQKLDLEHLITSGLALVRNPHNTYTNAYGRFRGRLMFPICDDQGRVVGFSARVLHPETDKMGKYINTTETPLFHKGHLVFGLDKAKREIVQKKCAIICEGQLDLITCHAAGFKNVVAPQGTAFTTEQARILKRFTPQVILCFDGDRAGQDANMKALDVLLTAGLTMKVAPLPENHDPDSFIKANGAAAFGEFIARSREFFDFYLSRLCQLNNQDSDLGRLQIVQSMGEALSKANQPLLTDTYAQKTAQILGVSPQTVLDEFARSKENAPRIRTYNETPSSTPIAIAEQNEPDPEPPAEREEWLLRLFLINEKEWAWMSQSFQAEWIENELVRKILIASLDRYNAGNWSLHALMDDFKTEPPVCELLCKTSATSGEEIPEAAQQLRQLTKALRARYCDHLLGKINVQLSAPGLTLPEQLSLLQQKARIREMKNAPLFDE